MANVVFGEILKSYGASTVNDHVEDSTAIN